MAGKLTVAQVRERVAAIEASAGDDEGAHYAEDQLHQDVLRTIANSDGEFAALAVEALRTCDIDFARWYA